MNRTLLSGDAALAHQISTLRTEFRIVRHAAARAASGATVHRLTNCITTIQAALVLLETDAAPHRPESVPVLLRLAAARLREARQLVAHAGCGRT